MTSMADASSIQCVVTGGLSRTCDPTNSFVNECLAFTSKGKPRDGFTMGTNTQAQASSQRLRMKGKGGDTSDGKAHTKVLPSFKFVVACYHVVDIRGGTDGGWADLHSTKSTGESTANRASQYPTRLERHLVSI